MRRFPLASTLVFSAVVTAAACLEFKADGVYKCDPAVEDCSDAGLPPGPSDGSTGTDGSTATDGGDAGMDGGHPAVRWCNEFGAAVCDLAIRCSYFAEGHRASCEDYVRHSACFANARSAEDGLQRFDASAAATCLQLFKNEPTIDPASGQCLFPSFCNPFTPNAARGQVCSQNEDCLQMDDACGGPSCNQTCQPAGELGQPCTRFGSCRTGWCNPATRTCEPPLDDGATCQGDSYCRPSSYCDGCPYPSGCEGTCLALPGPGKECRMDGFPYCAPNAYCDFFVSECRARVAIGGACGGGEECVTEAYCDYSQLRCRARGGSGASCQEDSHCVEELACFAGKCGPPRGEGESCEDYADCDSSQNVSCDQILQTCLRYQRVDAGSPCTGDAIDCNDGSCKGAAQNPDGGVGMTGTCQPIAIGDPCNGHFSCGQGQYCHVDATGEGKCAAAGSGTPCSSYSNCLSGHFCTSKGICAPQRMIGQPCTAAESEECRASVCRISAPDAGTGTCGERSKTDGGCVRDQDCVSTHACIGGKCALIGVVGTQCSGPVCLNGKCERYPDGGSLCTPRIESGTCLWDGECVSGTCNGVCAPICE